MASYAILDGLIGNTDRHHGNWGLIYNSAERTYTLAPTFDHSSSLGRDISDDVRHKKLASGGGIVDYILRGEGQTFVDHFRTVAPPPLQLAQMICLSRPDAVRPILERLRDVPNRDFRNAINRTPADIMSRTAKKFAYQMVMTSKAELLRGFQ